MIRNLPLIALSVLALAACNTQPENVVAGETPDPMANELASAPPVELPPSIAKSKTYRCKDNGTITIDWLSDGKSANLRVGDMPAPTALKAAADGEPLTAEGGFSLTGNAEAPSVTLTLPGKGAQACKG